MENGAAKTSETAAERGDAAPVFISCASHDAEIARSVCESLESQGIRCWMAPRDIKPGAQYADAIVRAITEAKALVLVMSASAVDSAHVAREVERAASKRKPIIPFRIDTADLNPEFEYFLSNSQWIDVPALGMKAALAKLAEATGSISASPGIPTTPHPVSYKRTTRRAAIAAAILIALAAAVVVGLHFWPGSRGSPQQAAVAVSDKSIAVLPFADMSEKKDQEYFADGLSEELIDMLTKVSDLRVPARTSSFYFKGKQATIADIAKALSVSHVLEGSVRKSGDRLRVTAQLIRVDNGYHLWSETYDRKIDDIFKIQDEIASSVVSALKVSLLQGQTPRARPIANGEAYTLYLQAHAIRYRAKGPSDSAIATDYLKQALKLEPGFALAWAELANNLAADYSTFGTLPYQATRDAAHDSLERALKLDSTLPLAYVAKTRVAYQLDWDWDAAEDAIRKATELEPGNAEAFRMYGYLATTLGRFNEAIDLLKHAISVDPLQPWNYIAMGFATHGAGDLSTTEQVYRRAIDLNPTSGKVHYLLGSVLLKSRPEDALVEMGKETDAGYRHCGLALALSALGRRKEADSELKIAEQTFPTEKAYWIALIYAARNDPDQAFAWLDRAFRQHDDGLLWIKGDLMLSNLTSDPRYKAFLKKMNLPE